MVDLDEFVGHVAVILTIGLNCVGIITCKNIIFSGKVGNISHLPFLSGIVTFNYWLMYGIYVIDKSITLVNAIASFLQTVYFLIYFVYADTKFYLVRDAVIALFIIAMGFVFTFFGTLDIHDIIFVLGVTCNILTVTFFASPLATLTQVIKTKNTESMSFPLSVMSAIVTSSWVLYGHLIEDVFVQIPNTLGFFLAIIQLLVFAIYPRHNTHIIDSRKPYV